MEIVAKIGLGELNIPHAGLSVIRARVHYLGVQRSSVLFVCVRLTAAFLYDGTHVEFVVASTL